MTYCASHVVNVHRGGCYGQPARGVMPAGSPMQLDPTPLADTPSGSMVVHGMHSSCATHHAHARLACVPCEACPEPPTPPHPHTHTLYSATLVGLAGCFVGTAEANKLAHRRKMEGMSESIMEGSDLARFAAVSEARVGKNLPSHVDAAKASSTAATSLASSLLSKN